MSQEFPDFFARAPRIAVRDPLAEFLGAAGGGLLEYSYADAVKLAGHSCPTVAGAYLATLEALSELYPEEPPERGAIRVELRERLEDGVAGVIASVAGLITGAAAEGGFKGIAGRFERRGLLVFGAPIGTDLRFTRLDTGRSVETRLGPAPAAPGLMDALRRALEGDASAAERADFARAWQARVAQMLRAPVDGVVTARLAEPGSTVLAGQALLKVIDPASAWVRVRVDQARAGALREGQRARIELRSGGGVPLAGEVARIELLSDAVTEERLVNVTFDAPPRGLSMGELAEVTIDGGRIENALVIPSAALHRAGKESGVWRVDGGRARFQPVKTGMQSLDGRTELLAGLDRGDELIVYTNAQLAEGDRVRVGAP